MPVTPATAASPPASVAARAKAAAFLRQQGFTNVRNLTGGIIAWAEQVDLSMPKY